MIYCETCAPVLSDNLEAVGGKTAEKHCIDEAVYAIVRDKKKKKKSTNPENKRFRRSRFLSPGGGRAVFVYHVNPSPATYM